MLSVRLLAFVIIVVGGLWTRESCRAEEPSTAFMAWWESLMQGGADGPAIDGFMLDYTITDTRPVPTRSEVAALRAQIGEVRSHSRTHELADMERRLSSPPVINRMRLWRMGNAWRWSSEVVGTGSEQAEYFDQVWTPDAAWQMTRDNLVTGDAATVAASMYRIDVSSSGVAHDVAMFTNGQLAAAPEQGLTLTPRMTGPDTWRATARRDIPDGTIMEVTAEGTWDEAAREGRLLVQEWLVSPAGGPRQTQRMEFTGWERLGGLARPVARHVSVFIDGKPHRRYDITSIEPYTRGEFAALTKAPSLTSNDPVRGPVTFRSVVELKKGKETHVSTDDVSGSRSILGESELIREQSGFVRVLGWGLAAGILLMLVAIQVLRRTRA